MPAYSIWDHCVIDVTLILPFDRKITGFLTMCCLLVDDCNSLQDKKYNGRRYPPIENKVGDGENIPDIYTLAGKIIS